ncbi:Peptidase inhibitor R3HDML [Varanus komodoensis]|nr:Peptidase inhibitor R3HDML [Varanus komodoensis]
MTLLHMQLYFTGSVFWMIQKSSSFMLPNTTELLYPTSSAEAGLLSALGVPRTRRKRYISPRDMSALLDYHNQVRAQVSPPAANMEYMVPAVVDCGNAMRIVYLDFSKAFDKVPHDILTNKLVSYGLDGITTRWIHSWLENQLPSEMVTSPSLEVWDERLARSAEAWAKQCMWGHGPPQLMKFLGQNLAIQSGRYHSAVDLVKSWYYEKQHYSFPYPYECKPRCPSKCSGSVCSHYTQDGKDPGDGYCSPDRAIHMHTIGSGDNIREMEMVWASSNRIGCAIHTCTNMNVWGNTWRRAVYLVCNYAIKGNWIGEAPYKMGRPCSACPPNYGGTCSNNMCYSGLKSNKVSWF